VFAIDWLASPEAWLALVTLISLEVILGIDNIIFISILVGNLPAHQRERARRLGIGLALLLRLGLLACIAWIIGLVEPWFSLFGKEFSGKDLIMIGGGLFLLAKATTEIHVSLEHVEAHSTGPATKAFKAVIVQIAVLDMVFSLDSVLTAVGLVDHLSIMAIAIVISVLVMLLAAKTVGEFVERNPTVKMLALSFLMLIGFTLVAEGFGVHVPKGYIYVSVVFSMFVETLNIAARRRRQVEKVHLYRKNV
jgi:predicted tellurium resistance membrane protein TerC